MARYEKYAQILSNLGYDVTPLNGKVPILKGWQDRPDTALDFKKHKNSNIGLVTGGKHNVIAVDIDVSHIGAVAIIKTLSEDLLGSAPERIGNAPKTMFVYRCSEPFKKSKTAIYDINNQDSCVEVLAEGQQFCASGKHPDTKKNYSWPNDNLLEIPPSELTEVTAEDINNFIQTCNTALADYGSIKSKSLNRNNGSTSKYQFAANEQTTEYDKLLAALAYVDNNDLHYDDWVYVGFGICGAVGEDGLDLFHRWSKKSDKYDPTETDRLWNSIGTVTTIGAGSIFHMANQNGFDLQSWDNNLGPDDIDEFAVEGDTEPLPGETDEDGCFTAASVSGPLPEREWLLDQWFPYKTTGMLFGAGGIGKTLLMHQLGNKVALGEPFMGLATKKMPVLLALCEDDELELKRRQLDINTWLGVDDFGTGPDNCYLWPRIGGDNILVTFPNQGEDKAGAFYEHLCRKIIALKKFHNSDEILVILDTAADFFGGNENVRREVNTFVKKYLGSLSVEYNATVILLAHPSLAGLASGTGSSGSTAWENSVRSRAYFARVEDSDELRILSRKKSNYSAIGTDSDIQLIWDSGVMVIPSTPDQFDRLNAVKLKEAILSEIEDAWCKGTPYKSNRSEGRKVKTALPKAFPKEKKGPLLVAFNDLVEGGNIIHIERKGYKVEIGLSKAQTVEM